MNCSSSKANARRAKSRLHRQAKSRDVKLAKQSANMQDVFTNMGESKPNVVQLLVKADVQGSVEALRDSLNALSTGEVAVNVVASGWSVA